MPASVTGWPVFDPLPLSNVAGTAGGGTGVGAMVRSGAKVMV
ncbi:MAG TPA: hypothetical protein VMT36_00905 [Candidatus Saccharimonadia bacterium]|nr:hypothetical protein [Candidatus Saccharimonadia bacterium]